MITVTPSGGGCSCGVVYDQVARDAAVCDGHGAGAVSDVGRDAAFAVDDRVESHLGIFHLEILEQFGVLDAAHERDCRPLAVSGQPFEIVVEHPMAFADDPYAARVGSTASEEVVSVDRAVVPVPECQRAFATVEHIVAVGVRTRFVRDDFDLSLIHI